MPKKLSPTHTLIEAQAHQMLKMQADLNDLGTIVGNLIDIMHLASEIESTKASIRPQIAARANQN